MDVFAQATQAAFADPNVTELAVYTPVGSPPFTCRVVRRTMDAEQKFLSGAVLAAGFAIDVRAADVAQPQVGDQVALMAGTYRVRAWRTGQQRLSHTLDCDPVVS